MTEAALSTPAEDPETHRKSRILEVFLRILAGVFLITDSLALLLPPAYAPPWYGHLLLVAAWLLNRAGQYSVAALLSLIMFPLVTTAITIAGADARLTFTYLVIPVVASSLLLTRRGAMLFDGACFAFLLLTPVFIHQRVASVRTVLGPLILMAIGSALSMLMMVHRDELERDRQVARDRLIHELGQKNNELERFTHTVSHDLKSPLITIRGFLTSIQRDLSEDRTDRLNTDVERTLKATNRMQTLLDELLNLSRIGRVANAPERVAFAELAREAIAMVQGRLDTAFVKVNVEAGLPDVFVDRSRIVQVLQNLLDNSAKFLGDQRAPRITVGVRSGAPAAQALFFVQDNGIGVEPAYLERILGLFEKLDNRGAGTGVGLAIVQRIVEVHGGRLWVESAGKGHGTTVCFTLPTRPPATA